MNEHHCTILYKSFLIGRGPYKGKKRYTFCLDYLNMTIVGYSTQLLIHQKKSYILKKSCDRNQPSNSVAQMINTREQLSRRRTAGLKEQT